MFRFGLAGYYNLVRRFRRDHDVFSFLPTSCLSLAEPTVPNPENYPEEEREFNRYTLQGEYDALFVALLVERCRNDKIDLNNLSDYFRAHMNRGVVLLQQRTRSVADLGSLIPS